jgi:hypothetical protein
MHSAHLLQQSAIISLYGINIFVFIMEAVLSEWYELDFDVWFTYNLCFKIEVVHTNGKRLPLCPEKHGQIQIIYRVDKE